MAIRGPSQFKKSLGVGAQLFQQRLEDRLQAARLRGAFGGLGIHLLREMDPEEGFFPGGPVAKSVLEKGDQQAVALHVGLFAEEMDDRVLPEGDLIHLGGYFPQLPFGSDFAEVDGEQPEKLLDQIEGRADRRVEQGRDVLLEQVRIPDKDPSQLQVDDQGREQPPGPARFQGDDFQPGADVLDMGRVDPDLPVRIGAGEPRMLKPEGDQLLHKGVRQRVMIQLEDLSGHGGNAIQDGAAVLKTGGAFFQELENVSNKIVQILRRLLAEHQGQAAVDLDQRPAVNIGQGRDIDDMKEEIQFDQVFPAGIKTGPFQFVGHQQIAFDDLGVVGPVQVAFRFRTGLRPGNGRRRFQLRQQGGHRPMRQGLDDGIIAEEGGSLLPFPVEPVPGVGLFQPEGVGGLKDLMKKRIPGEAVEGKRLLPGRLQELLPIGRSFPEKENLLSG